MVSSVEPRRAGLTNLHRKHVNVHESKMAMDGVKAFAHYGSTELTMTPPRVLLMD
jgi:hypothetical protein